MEGEGDGVHEPEEEIVCCVWVIIACSIAYSVGGGGGGGVIATFCIKLPLLGYVDEAYIQLLYYMWRENNNITASSKIKVANDKA